MNYVYDVLLNFNKEMYEFYDWNLDDYISHIRKILVFRVDNKTMSDLVNNSIVVDSDFLIKISNRTEMFTKQNVKIINYAALFTNGSFVIGLKFDKNGEIIGRSKLLIDEELDILDSALNMNEYNLKYKLINTNKNEFFKTRKEVFIEKYISKKLDEVKDNKEMLKYLYYECFNEKNTDFRKMLLKLNKSLINNWDGFYNKVYNFFKLTAIKEK